MSERWLEGLYMGMRCYTNEAVVMRVSDGVMVRTRSTQRQEREVTTRVFVYLSNEHTVHPDVPFNGGD